MSHMVITKQQLENHTQIPTVTAITQERTINFEHIKIVVLSAGPIILGLLIAIITNWCNYR